jgi:short-subunit dehydrogenase
MVALLNPSPRPYAARMTFHKDQPVAAITGAGGGIGTATALELARAGYRLALSDVDEVSLADLAAALCAHGVEVTTRSVDVGDPMALDDWAAAVLADFGRVDVLINNAGVTTWGRYAEQSARDIDWVMDINIRGVMHGCRAFLPALRRAPRGHIVNVSSMIALFAGPLQTTYTASKWAILGFSKALRLELRPEGIGVSCIIPGLTATPFMSDSRSYDADGTATMGTLMRRYGMAPERVARRIGRAIVRNHGQVHVGLDCHVVALLQRFLPGLLPWFVGRMYRRFAPDGKLSVGGPS